MLHWRDHHALQTVVHVAVESALARISDDAVADVLSEIRQAVLDALDSQSSVTFALPTATPSGCVELHPAVVQSPPDKFDTKPGAPRARCIELPESLSLERSKVVFALATPAASPGVPRRVLDLSPEPTPSSSRVLAEPPANKLSLLARMHDSPTLARIHGSLSLPARVHDSHTCNHLSREILRSIFFYLPSSTHGFFDLMQASHVCRLWRSCILKHAALWSTIRGLSAAEYRHLVTIMSRTKDVPVDLQIDLRSRPLCSPRALGLSIQRHIYHIRHLEIFLGSGQVHEWYALAQGLVELEAPILESCTIWFPTGIPLPPMLFNRAAPRLKSFSAHLELLPDICPALRNVECFEALYATRHPTETELARVTALFPALTSLILDLPPIVTEVGSAGLVLLPHLKSLRVTDSNSRTGVSVVLPVLDLLKYSRLGKLQILTPSEATLQALRSAMSHIQSLYILHAPDSKAQIGIQGDPETLCISFLSSPMKWIDGVLQHQGILRGLTGLHVGMSMRSSDWEQLFAATFPALYTLTLYICDYRSSALVVLLDYTSAKWHLPALRNLTICDREPVLDLEPFARPTVSAVSLTRFIVDTLQLGSVKAKMQLMLTMDGVGFEENLSGPETEALRCVVAGLTCRNYPC
ncbi:hypothetical protein EXIGLDRAFT_836793 [Exidia glandulosa HHB12029]|uniref:F-box domain-containing protein n=1 Tax=Exidia glandulosa HHB12029 TaxID=1314781 RepID=A0A165HFF8_EXIGL|nr:hypothetical protein EXIGLDRAFT_836793 [Exidia glandulosa HHB12029]